MARSVSPGPAGVPMGDHGRPSDLLAGPDLRRVRPVLLRCDTARPDRRRSVAHHRRAGRSGRQPEPDRHARRITGRRHPDRHPRPPPTVPLLGRAVLGGDDRLRDQPQLPVFGACRFITGFGVGGLLPTAVAMASEFADPAIPIPHPGRGAHRPPVGGLLASIAAIYLVPGGDFRWVYAIGAAALIVVLPLAVVALPESPSFLRSRGRIRRGRPHRHSPTACRSPR